MAQKLTPFLMFDGGAEEAMEFYTSLFDDARIINIERYGPDQAGAEGSVYVAEMTLNGQNFKCIDSPVKHDFTFTPAVSIYVDCEAEDEIYKLFLNLSEGGQTLMPLDTYPFAAKFTWVVDRFGVSWQLSLT